MPLLWSDVCRLCAAIDVYSNNIFNKYNNNKELAESILKYLAIPIKTEDDLSLRKVCEECGDKISDFHTFALRCERTQAMFQMHRDITVLQDSLHLESLKNEYNIGGSVNIKKEDGSDYGDFINNEIDMNYLQINDKKITDKLRSTKRKSSKLNGVKKKRGRPRKNQNSKCFKIELEENFINNDDDGHTTGSIELTTKDFDGSELNNILIDKEGTIDCIEKNNRRTSKKNHKKKDVMCIIKCDSCERTFASEKSLIEHAHIHLPKNELPYVCCKCAKRFANQRLLKNHEIIHKPREERYIWPCDVCQIKFPTKGSLKTHKRTIHEKLKPFMCDLCGNAFSSKANLQEHRIRHGSIKNYICDKCQKGFKTKGSLVRHIDTHEDTAYMCPLCPKLLNSRRTLRNHLYVHDEQANEACPFCEKTFKRKKDIKSHLKLHTGERQYSCPWCPRTFSNGSNCRVHKRRMHPNEFQLADMKHLNDASMKNNTKEDVPKRVIHATIRGLNVLPLKSENNFSSERNQSEELCHTKQENTWHSPIIKEQKND